MVSKKVLPQMFALSLCCTKHEMSRTTHKHWMSQLIKLYDTAHILFYFLTHRKQKWAQISS